MAASTAHSPAFSRRAFAKLALATGGAAAIGSALAGCSQDQTPAADKDGGASEETRSQVIVTMPTGAEPAAN